MHLYDPHTSIGTLRTHTPNVLGNDERECARASCTHHYAYRHTRKQTIRNENKRMKKKTEFNSTHCFPSLSHRLPFSRFISFGFAFNCNKLFTIYFYIEVETTKKQQKLREKTMIIRRIRRRCRAVPDVMSTLRQQTKTNTNKVIPWSVLMAVWRNQQPQARESFRIVRA